MYASIPYEKHHLKRTLSGSTDQASPHKQPNRSPSPKQRRRQPMNHQSNHLIQCQWNPSPRGIAKSHPQPSPHAKSQPPRAPEQALQPNRKHSTIFTLCKRRCKSASRGTNLPRRSRWRGRWCILRARRGSPAPTGWPTSRAARLSRGWDCPRVPGAALGRVSPAGRLCWITRSVDSLGEHNGQEQRALVVGPLFRIRPIGAQAGADMFFCGGAVGEARGFEISPESACCFTKLLFYRHRQQFYLGSVCIRTNDCNGIEHQCHCCYGRDCILFL